MSLLTRLRCSALTAPSFYTSSKLLLTRTRICRQPPRYLFQFFKKKKPEHYKLIDNVPDQYKLIYYNRMEKYVTGGQISLVLCTVVLLLSAGLKQDWTDVDMQYEDWSKTTKRTENEMAIYVACFILTLAVVHVLLSRFTLRIYRRPKSNEYVMIMPGNLPWIKDKIKFKRGQIELLQSTGVLPWKESRYLISSENLQKRTLLVENYFKTPADLNIMIGIQRDPDMEEE